jgi:hypothetical protein
MVLFVAAMLCVQLGKNPAGRFLYGGMTDEGYFYPPYVQSSQTVKTSFGSTVSGFDPLYLIQAVNGFQLFGQKGALERLREFGRYWEWPDGGCPYWLTRLLFIPKSPDFIFPIFGAGQASEYRDEKYLPYKTYPKFVVQGIPFHFAPSGIQITGEVSEEFAESTDQRPTTKNQEEEDEKDGIDYFQRYLDENQDKWTLRKSPLVPPNDPFLTLPMALEIGKKIVPLKEATEEAMSQITWLVRTVYRPKRSRDEDISRGFYEAHEHFLKLGGHWDRKRNLYVRFDGTFDQDEPITVEPDGYQFFTTDGIKVKAMFKFEDRETVRMTVDCFEVKGHAAFPVFVAMRNIKTGKEVERISPNCPVNQTDDAAHFGFAYPQRASCVFKFSIADPFRFEMTYNERIVKSPVFVN